MLKRIIFPVLFLFALSVDVCAAETEAQPTLKVVYFTSSDRDVEPDYQARLTRVMEEVQRFYREEMKRNGFGPKTFALERDDDGKMVIHLAKSDKPMKEYHRKTPNAAGRLRGDALASLKKEGKDFSKETLVLFAPFLEWKDGKSTEIGPYCGGGSQVAGTAWVFDDRRLDAKLLASNEPGGWYGGRKKTLGESNTIYIGGVTHELGHALSLPHVCQTQEEKKTLGTALMGAGNHTYGREQRTEQKGTFLTRTSAIPLSVHRLFREKQPKEWWKNNTTTDVDEPKREDGRIILKGQVKSDREIIGIAAWYDGVARRADYDAVGWTTDVDDQGKFEIAIGDLKKGDHEIRLAFFFDNGGKRVLKYKTNLDD